MDISVQKLKKYAKDNNSTINDILLAITSKSLKQYMVSKGDNKTNKVTMAVPFTMRDTTSKPEKVVLCNDFISVSLVLDLEEDLN